MVPVQIKKTDLKIFVLNVLKKKKRNHLNKGLYKSHSSLKTSASFAIVLSVCQNMA